MNKNKTLKVIVLIFIIRICFISCTKTNPIAVNPTNTNPTTKSIENAYNPAQVTMTLSSLCDEIKSMSDRQELVNYLKNTSFATKGDWELVWLDELSKENYKECCLITQYAQDPKKSTYAIAFGGTSSDLHNILFDLNIGQLSTMCFANLNYLNQHHDKPLVSKGLNDATILYHNAVDIHSTLVGSTIKSFLIDAYKRAAREGRLPLNLYFTGHSQGAAVAVLYAQMLFQSIDELKSISKMYGVKTNKDDLNGNLPINIYLYTFALPSFGTQSLINYMDNLQQIGEGIVGLQCFNNYSIQQDEIPLMVDSLGAIGTTPNMYGYPTTPSLYKELSLIVKPVCNALAKSNIVYTALYGSIQKNHNLGMNTVSPANFKVPAVITNIIDFGHYIAWHHNHNAYLTMLGATPTPSADKEK